MPMSATSKWNCQRPLPSRLDHIAESLHAQAVQRKPSRLPIRVGHRPRHGQDAEILPGVLSGPAIFVFSHGGEAFPTLTMVLQGDKE